MQLCTVDATAPVVPRDLLGDRFEIEREIGAGAMAVVFLARDTQCQRPVAIKVLNTASDESAVARFRNEVATIANLQHPNIVPLFDCGEVEGLPYYVMPYVAGETLRARLDRERQLSIREALRIAVSVARALHCAHRQGVVHRDVKPENILLRDDQVMIVDFGIAFSPARTLSPRLTQTGSSIGTPLYMSPEQASGDETVDHRSDVYSLAVVLYEMLCGETPHSGPNTRAIIARILTYRATPASALRRTISRGLDAALARALEKEPADRFATAAEFADAIEAV